MMQHEGNRSVSLTLNPSPNDKFLYVTKLKALADDKLNVAKMTTVSL